MLSSDFHCKEIYGMTGAVLLYQESKEPGEPQESGFLPKKSESSVRNVLKRCRDRGANCCHSLHGQIFGQNGMCQKSADVHLFCNFLDSPASPQVHFGNDLVFTPF